MTVKNCSYSCWKDHDISTESHKKAMEIYTVFIMQTTGESMPIEENVEFTPSKKTTAFGAAIALIVVTVILLGKLRLLKS